MNQHNQFDTLNDMDALENLEQPYKDKIAVYEQELADLQCEIERQKQVIKRFSKYVDCSQEVLLESCDILSIYRKSKLYTIAIVLQRMIDQFILGNRESRGDFLHWIWNNLTRLLPLNEPKNPGKPLYSFEKLYQLQQHLEYLLDSTTQVLSVQLGVDSDSFASKRGRQFFIFAGVPYFDVGGGQRFAQIANTLNSMGYRVYYIYAFDSVEAKRTTMYIPAVMHVQLDKYSVDDFAVDVQKNDVLIFEIPYVKFKPYMDYANQHGNPTVYEHVDNWDSSLGCLFYEKEAFSAFVRDVKHITVTARVLGEKIEEAGRKDYIYCPNAVDSSLFEPSKTYMKPADLVTGKKTLLYFGSLWGEWFDWDLITYVAKNCDCTINLIGDYQPVADKIRKLPKNIHFLGLKKHEDLPAYLSYSDIALLPFKNSVIGKYVSPLKIFEYIAMNKPVLATPLEDIAGYPNVVASDDKEVWVRAIEKGIPAKDATVFTAENNWYARCNQILDTVGRLKTSYPPVSVIILNRNNKNVIFRCVNSLLAFSGAYNTEIIVVDNDSTDGSYELLLEEYGSKIKVIKNEKNGCSCGRNLGVQHATNEMLLFLDSDQWITGEHYLDAAFEIMEHNSGIGAVGWAAGWLGKDVLNGIITDSFPNRGIKGAWVMYRTDIAYLGSGGLLTRKSLFHKIGGFDEFYDPTCFEDTDFSLAVRDAGYELAYCPYMAIMHLPHQTTQSGSKAHLKLMERNGNYFLNKWKNQNPKLLEYRL